MPASDESVQEEACSVSDGQDVSLAGLQQADSPHTTPPHLQAYA